jgi:phosphoribosylformylglycinamidine (FGAM) synthase-like enzyme
VFLEEHVSYKIFNELYKELKIKKKAKKVKTLKGLKNNEVVKACVKNESGTLNLCTIKVKNGITELIFKDGSAINLNTAIFHIYKEKLTNKKLLIF